MPQGQLEACNSLHDGATALCQSDVSNWKGEHDTVDESTQATALCHSDVSNYDSVDKSVQASRHVDAMKVWLMWRAKGPQGFEAQIEQLMDLSRYDIKCLK